MVTIKETKEYRNIYYDISSLTNEKWSRPEIAEVLCRIANENRPRLVLEVTMSCFNVVLGGTEINDEDVGYGSARYLVPAEVKEVYEAIKDIKEEEFKSKFDCDEFARNDIYPEYSSNDEFDYVWGYFTKVRDMFEKASLTGKYMLLYLN